MLVLLKWVRSLQDQTTKEVPSVTGDEVASNPDPVDPSLDVLLAQMDGPDTAAPEPTGEYQNMGKALYIVDFLNRANVGSSDTTEREVCTQGGAQLVLRSARQKPLPEQVTLAQWIGANARIMERLIRSRQLQSADQICQYLDYTVKFSDYAQVNELPSVMVYDLEFRRKQYERQ